MAWTRLQRHLCVSTDQMITSLVEEEPRHARFERNQCEVSKTGSSGKSVLFPSDSTTVGYVEDFLRHDSGVRWFLVRSSYQSVLELVSGEDLESEEFLVTIAVCFPLHRLDLVVRSFQRACGDSEVVVGQDSCLMLPQSLGERLEHLDPGRFGPGDPVLEESLCLGLVRLRPKLPEILLHVVGGRERLVQSQGRNQTPL